VSIPGAPEVDELEAIPIVAIVAAVPDRVRISLKSCGPDVPQVPRGVIVNNAPVTFAPFQIGGMGM
jgi:hypothetical protein